MGLFHAFEQQPIYSCVPFFNEKAAVVAMIRHEMHGHTAYHNSIILGNWLSLLLISHFLPLLNPPNGRGGALG